jgi:hypothetical protein
MMRSRRVSMKLSLLVLLGVCSWFLTSRIAGKRALGQAAPAQVASGFSKTRVAPNKNGAAGLPTGAVPVVNTAGGTFDALTVTPGPRGVVVEARVTLMDKRPGKSYMWGVLIKDEGFDNVISNITYGNQAFSPPADGKVMSPTFKDVFQLPAGVYHVEVVVYDRTPMSEFGLFDPTRGPKAELNRYERVTVSQ